MKLHAAALAQPHSYPLVSGSADAYAAGRLNRSLEHEHDTNWIARRLA
jgi:hypothetical protein